MDYIRGQNSRMTLSAVGVASCREIAPLKLFSGIAFRFNRSHRHALPLNSHLGEILRDLNDCNIDKLSSICESVGFVMECKD